MARLFLHVGQPKSGTTALQRAFAAYSDETDAPQVYYPRAGRRERKLVAHHNLAYELHAPNQFSPSFGSWQDLADELEAQGEQAGTALLSSEAFRMFLAPVVASKIHKLFPGAEKKVILYLRPQWEYVESGYNQLIRFLKTEDHIEEFYDHTGAQITDYRAIVMAWQKAMGPENLICLPFDASVRAEGIVSHVLRKAIGLDIEMPPATQVNQKFGLRALSAVRHVRDGIRAGLDAPEAELSSRMVMQLSYLSQKWPRETRDFSFMTEELKARIYEESRDTNRWLAEQFEGFDSPAFLDPPPPGKAPVVTRFPELTDEEKADCKPFIKAAVRAGRQRMAKAPADGELPEDSPVETVTGGLIP
ncbi:hypothetical protein Salmuc_03181 [Salipiger mucosus DSM 16094]|uniref:Sulfotransferase family protein n=1 Tax=Salipiger mucosus DSM 16094 TaxID=1123237 RepID=S9Q6A3_9RHOB|nr:hypothetical protein Salmuc_03181 [Salipiger mucosus DSM 16094]